MRHLLIDMLTLLLPGMAVAQPPAATDTPLVRATDLNVGETAAVNLASGNRP